jgi:hypothetical protein
MELFYLKRKLSTVITRFFGQKNNLHVGGRVTFYLLFSLVEVQIVKFLFLL